MGGPGAAGEGSILVLEKDEQPRCHRRDGLVPAPGENRCWWRGLGLGGGGVRMRDGSVPVPGEDRTLYRGRRTGAEGGRAVLVRESKDCCRCRCRG